VERGFAPVETDLFHQEWERRKLRNKVHLSQGGCLGPCMLANVVTLFFDGRFHGFMAVDAPEIVLAIYDYIEAMMGVTQDQSASVPVPDLLQDRVFNFFDWQNPANSMEAMGDSYSPSNIDIAVEAEANGVLFLTHADTDLLALSKVRDRFPEEFPELYGHNLSEFKDESQFVRFLGQTLPKVGTVVARVLGGRAGFRDGFDALVQACHANDKQLICVSGTADLDPELTAVSTTPVYITHDIYQYLTLSGQDNIEHLFRYIADNLHVGAFGYELPTAQARHGIYMNGDAISQDVGLKNHYDESKTTADPLLSLPLAHRKHPLCRCAYRRM